MESARIALKAATPVRVTVASAPPASIASARPLRMCSVASPRAWLPEAQAVDGHVSGPFRPSSIETWPAPMFAITSGMKSGETRSGPRFSTTSVWVTKLSSPPMPQPTAAPTRGADAGDTVSAASSTARRPAATASWAKQVHAPGGPPLHEVGGVEALDLAGDGGRRVDRLVARDRRGAAAARDGRGPVLLAPDAERGHQADAGHHHPPAAVPVPHRAHEAPSPPSTESTAPVTKAASSEQRNATAPATSSGSPRRPSGVAPRIDSRCSSERPAVMSVAM